MRHYRYGTLFAMAWFAAALILIGAGLESAWGPFGWLLTWQLRTFGSNSSVFLAIPLLPIAWLPLLVARLDWINQRRPLAGNRAPR